MSFTLASSETPPFPMLPPFPPFVRVSLHNQTAGLLFRLVALWPGGALSFSPFLSLSLTSSTPPLFPASLHLCPLVFLSLLCYLSLPFPPSVTAALEGMSFHGRFAAISKMAALPNGQLPWF